MLPANATGTGEPLHRRAMCEGGIREKKTLFRISHCCIFTEIQMRSPPSNKPGHAFPRAAAYEIRGCRDRCGSSVEHSGKRKPAADGTFPFHHHPFQWTSTTRQPEPLAIGRRWPRICMTPLRVGKPGHLNKENTFFLRFHVVFPERPSSLG
jgi:hypothetical protein